MSSCTRLLATLWICTWVVPAGAASPATSPVAKAAPSPRIDSIQILTEAAPRRLAVGEAVQVNQRFVMTAVLPKPLHVYLLHDSHQRAPQLHYPAPQAVGTPSPAGTLLLPGPGDWFRIPAVSAGDRLCLIVSETPLSRLSCEDDEPSGVPKRGDDTPPPPPLQKSKTVSVTKHPPPKPIVDNDTARGPKQWVLPIPLAGT